MSSQNTAPRLSLGQGLITRPFQTTPYASAATQVAIQADGRIVVAGTEYLGNLSDFIIARDNSDGTLDRSFDHDSRNIVDFGSNLESVRWLSVAADGKILLGGTSGASFALTRFNPDGSVDTGFPGDGRLEISLGDGYDNVAVDLELLPGGDQLLTRTAWNGLASARYIIKQGELETDYGLNGVATLPHGSAGAELIAALALATGADVAESIGLTGAANRGADWLLEASTGLAISAPLESGFGE